MAHAQDYWTLKKAYAALQSSNFSLAAAHFRACKSTAKLIFNLAVLAIWQGKAISVICGLLRDALGRDPFLAVAAFYLGVLEERAGGFQDCLRGLRNCQYIDYTAVGMPFLLEREDVLFNLVSLQQPIADPATLNKLSIQSISSLLLASLPTCPRPRLRVPPIYHPKMIFNLLPACKVEPEPLELKGPEHVSFILGEDDYFSGFPDAHNRQIKLNLLKRDIIGVDGGDDGDVVSSIKINDNKESKII